jgi:hypothetical protein
VEKAKKEGKLKAEEKINEKALVGAGIARAKAKNWKQLTLSTRTLKTSQPRQT